MLVPEAWRHSFPFQFHDPTCRGDADTQFTLNVVQYGRKNLHIGCCTCTKKRMSDIIELINSYCFDKGDMRQRFFFYTSAGHKCVAPADVVEKHIHPQYRVLSVSVSCLFDEEALSDDEGKILVRATPPLSGRVSSSSSDGCVSETSHEGSDGED